MERGLMLILNFKKSLLRNSEWLLINFIVLVGFVLLSANSACAQTIPLFNLGTFDSQNIEIKADETSFDKKNSEISAFGNVQIVLELKNCETVEATGSFAKYNTITGKGKVWGKSTSIKYSIKNSSSPVTIHAKEIQFDKSSENIKANGDVVVVSSSGTIHSDNALFDKKTSGAIFGKGKTRPVAEFIYKGKKQIYNADRIILYDNEDTKKVFMEGDVKGKIEMEDNLMEGVK
jgi:lipopolysaccharide export system protein LptA